VVAKVEVIQAGKQVAEAQAVVVMPLAELLDQVTRHPQLQVKAAMVLLEVETIRKVAAVVAQVQQHLVKMAGMALHHQLLVHL
jgi:hypothetical protein